METIAAFRIRLLDAFAQLIFTCVKFLNTVLFSNKQNRKEYVLFYEYHLTKNNILACMSYYNELKLQSNSQIRRTDAHVRARTYADAYTKKSTLVIKLYWNKYNSKLTLEN